MLRVILLVLLFQWSHNVFASSIYTKLLLVPESIEAVYGLAHPVLVDGFEKYTMPSEYHVSICSTESRYRCKELKRPDIEGVGRYLSHILKPYLEEALILLSEAKLQVSGAQVLGSSKRRQFVVLVLSYQKTKKKRTESLEDFLGDLPHISLCRYNARDKEQAEMAQHLVEQLNSDIRNASPIMIRFSSIRMDDHGYALLTAHSRHINSKKKPKKEFTHSLDGYSVPSKRPRPEYDL